MMNNIHSILIIAVIAIVVVVQLKYFFKLKKRLIDFRTIFSKKELKNYDSLIVISSSIPKAIELEEKYNCLIEKKKELFELEDNDYKLNKLEEEIEYYKYLLIEKNMKITRKFEANSYLFSDKNAIHRLFSNLLANAINHSNRNSQIEVEIFK